MVSIVFGGMVCYKELLSFGGRCFRSCRRKQYEAIEVHVNSIEGLWLAAYLAKKRMAKTLNVESERPFEAQRFGKLAAAFDASDADHGVVSAEHFESGGLTRCMCVSGGRT